MKCVKVYSRTDINRLTRKRESETKLGERVICSEQNWKQDLTNSEALFVVIGIPEDIGVRANQGRPGAATAFKPALESFLNQQSNLFLDGSSVFVLGEIEVTDLMEQAHTLDHHKPDELTDLRKLVAEIDEQVASVIAEIVSLGKIPVVIGGGHNNAFGNITGASKALGKKMSVINCDPHSDFRPIEGRHSGNAFSYAFEAGSLARYAVFALHEQYNSEHALSAFRQNSGNLFYRSFEQMMVRGEMDFGSALNDCIGFVKHLPCGIEIDLDSITNVPSSAKTSSGLTPLQARQFIHQCASQLKPVFLHVAEGAPVLSHIKADNKTGKLIAYLITDFMKAVLANK